MRILVVGAGAVGGLFARSAALHSAGLQILNPLGDFSVRPVVVETNALGRRPHVLRGAHPRFEGLGPGGRRRS